MNVGGSAHLLIHPFAIIEVPMEAEWTLTALGGGMEVHEFRPSMAITWEPVGAQ